MTTGVGFGDGEDPDPVVGALGVGLGVVREDPDPVVGAFVGA